MKYKRFLKSTTVQATKIYEKWSWSRHLELWAIHSHLVPTTSNVSDSHISETPLQEAGTPPPSQDAESSYPLSPASLEMSPPLIKKTEEKAVDGGLDKNCWILRK